MKAKWCLFLTFLMFFSCGKNEKIFPENYIEFMPSFFDLRHSDWTKSDWIRKPENLKSVHETFKSFGYDKLEKLVYIGKNEFLIEGVYIKKNIYYLFDSLEISYNNQEIQDKYYIEFWQRRKSENNDSIVFEIVKEINYLKSKSRNAVVENQVVNDTLLSLLKVEFDIDEYNEETFYQKFETLKKYNFHQSAYNLLFERVEYEHLKLDREKLVKELTKSNEDIYPWIMDNMK